MEQLAERAISKQQRLQRKVQPVAPRKANEVKPKKPGELQRYAMYNITPAHSLASPAGRAMVAKLQADLLADPKKAHKFFVDAGILTRAGNLTKRYGG